jgi:DNA-binding LytR/AlgR family response regulator
MRETTSSALKDRRILIVEDEYMTADDLRRDLEGLGARVLGPVARVSDALSLLEADGMLDGAILDVNLGGEKVFPVADALRSRGIRFVFSTGYDEWALPDAYNDVPRCEKPIDMARLARTLFDWMP